MNFGVLQMSTVVWFVDTPIHALNAITFQDAALLIYMGLGGTLIAYYFWMKGAQQLGPDRVTSLFNLMPVFTVAISVLTGGDVGWIQIAGIFLVGCGILIGNAYPVLKQQLTALRLKQQPQ